jgi:hypothetical protein
MTGFSGRLSMILLDFAIFAVGETFMTNKEITKEISGVHNRTIRRSYLLVKE